MDHHPEDEEHEDEVSPLSILTSRPLHTAPSALLKRRTDSGIGSGATPEFRPQLRVEIPKGPQRPQTSSLPSTAHHSHHPRHSSSIAGMRGAQSSIPNHSRAISNHTVSHTQSRTWTNPKMNERDKWDYVKRNLHKMELIHRSPYVPHTFQGWMHFKSARAGDVLKEGNEKLARRQKDNRYVLSGIEPVKILPVMKGKTFNDGRSLVLAEKTIWSRPDKPSLLEYPTAPWPCKEEMREEGDERNTSRFGRFLGLPRHPGNETVNWKQKKHLLPLEFDNIWHLPDKESYERSREEIDDETRELMESLLGEDLLEAIDS